MAPLEAEMGRHGGRHLEAAPVPGGDGGARRVANTLAEQLDFDAPPGAVVG